MGLVSGGTPDFSVSPPRGERFCLGLHRASVAGGGVLSVWVGEDLEVIEEVGSDLGLVTDRKFLFIILGHHHPAI